VREGTRREQDVSSFDQLDVQVQLAQQAIRRRVNQFRQEIGNEPVDYPPVPLGGVHHTRRKHEQQHHCRREPDQGT